MTKFGDPNHPWQYSTAHARKAGKKARSKSPWGRGPMANTVRAKATFERNQRARTAPDREDP
jgi:hypothetical protein